MGRKKIEIKHISSHKERVICFQKRKVGLLKKAAELSILCGTPVSIVFSDLGNTVHTFSSTPEISWKMSKSLLRRLGGCPFYVDYSNSDYPFNKLTMAAKDRMSAFEDSLGAREKSSILKKRSFSDLALEGVLGDREAVCSPGDGDWLTKRLRVDKSEQSSTSIEDAEEMSGNEKIQYFNKKISSYIKKRKMTETELITLKTLKSLIQINRDQRNPIRKVPAEQVLEMISGLKFKQYKFKRLVQDIEGVNKNWLEYILSPSGGLQTQNMDKVFKSLFLKPHRKKLSNNTSGLFSYVVKSNLSQFSLVRNSIFQKLGFSGKILETEGSIKGASVQHSSHLEEAFNPQKQNLKASIIERIIQTGIFCLSLNSACSTEKHVSLRGAEGIEPRNKKLAISTKSSVREPPIIQDKAMIEETISQASDNAVAKRNNQISDQRSFQSLGRPFQAIKKKTNSSSGCQKRNSTQKDHTKGIKATEKAAECSQQEQKKRDQPRPNLPKQQFEGVDDGLDIISESLYSYSSRRLDHSIQMLGDEEGYRSFIGNNLINSPEYPSTKATQFQSPRKSSFESEDLNTSLKPAEKMLDEPQTRWNHFSYAPVEEVVQHIF